MNRNRVWLFVISGIAFVVSMVAILLAGSYLRPVSAQEDGELWLTSAEAPADMAPERFSPPDRLMLPNQTDSPNAPDALVSWRVSGTALKPRENDVSYGINGSGGCAYVTAGDAGTVWNITPHLPQGATVDTLRMYYDDTSGSNSSAWFTVYDLYGSIVQEWSVTSSGSSGNSFDDSTTINHTIDHTTYSYLINWRPSVTGNTLQLCGFRVFYEPPPFGVAFLPSIIKE